MVRLIPQGLQKLPLQNIYISLGILRSQKRQDCLLNDLWKLLYWPEIMFFTEKKIGEETKGYGWGEEGCIGYFEIKNLHVPFSLSNTKCKIDENAFLITLAQEIFRLE